MLFNCLWVYRSLAILTAACFAPLSAPGGSGPGGPSKTSTATKRTTRTSTAKLVTVGAGFDCPAVTANQVFGVVEQLHGNFEIGTFRNDTGGDHVRGDVIRIRCDASFVSEPTTCSLYPLRNNTYTWLPDPYVCCEGPNAYPKTTTQLLPCQCKEGWGGSQCDDPICSSNCWNRGECRTPEICICDDGFGGTDCSQKLNDTKLPIAKANWPLNRAFAFNDVHSRISCVKSGSPQLVEGPYGLADSAYQTGEISDYFSAASTSDSKLNFVPRNPSIREPTMSFTLSGYVRFVEPTGLGLIWAYNEAKLQLWRTNETVSSLLLCRSDDRSCADRRMQCNMSHWQYVGVRYNDQQGVCSLFCGNQFSSDFDCQQGGYNIFTSDKIFFGHIARRPEDRAEPVNTYVQFSCVSAFPTLLNTSDMLQLQRRCQAYLKPLELEHIRNGLCKMNSTTQLGFQCVCKNGWKGNACNTSMISNTTTATAMTDAPTTEEETTLETTLETTQESTLLTSTPQVTTTTARKPTTTARKPTTTARKPTTTLKQTTSSSTKTKLKETTTEQRSNTPEETTTTMKPTTEETTTDSIKTTITATATKADETALVETTRKIETTTEEVGPTTTPNFEIVANLPPISLMSPPKPYTETKAETIVAGCTDVSPNYRTPPTEGGKPVSADFRFVIDRLASVDDVLQTVAVTGRLVTRWSIVKTSTCSVPGSSDGSDNNRYRIYNIADIWHPAIGFRNSVTDVVMKNENYHDRMEVGFFYGKYYLFEWHRLGMFTATCSFDLSAFPFDTQTCEFQFNMMEPKQLVIFANATIKLPNAETSGSTVDQWSFVSGNKRIDTMTLDSLDQASQATFFLTLARNPAYFIFNLIAPSILLIILCLFGFFIPPNISKRSLYDVGLVLTFAVNLSHLVNQLPKSSQWIAICTYVELLALACTLCTCHSIAAYLLVSSNPKRARRQLFCRLSCQIVFDLVGFAALLAILAISTIYCGQKAGLF